MENLQYIFSMDQLEELEEVNPNRTGKYNTDIKNKYLYLAGCVLKRARRKLI